MIGFSFRSKLLMAFRHYNCAKFDFFLLIRITNLLIRIKLPVYISAIRSFLYKILTELKNLIERF